MTTETDKPRVTLAAFKHWSSFKSGAAIKVDAKRSPPPEKERATRLFTMAEAAKELRKSPRWLREWLARNPEDAYGRPYCSKLGRTKVFREADITRILDATMDTKKCRSTSGRRTKARTGRSAAPTSGSLWNEAQELLRGPLQSSNERSSKARSSAANTPRSQSSQTHRPS